ncbi:BatA domain-containing protein [Planctomycetaceae bacterium SH139]
MQFLFPALAAGFLFLAVPPLVHLINMLRHRRQQWAAMEFLLASYRKQRRWIILRQLLLLLARLGVAALLIAMLAGWSGGSGWLDALGGKTTHHVVVLDDSFSMSDTSGGAAAYDRALSALDGLARRLAIAEGKHQLTVIRSSRAALVIRGGSEAADAAADMSAAELGADLRAVERMMATRPSPLDDDCGAALKLAGDLVKATDANRTVLYVMSDLREADWKSPETSKEALNNLVRLGTELRMIDCAVAPATNLAVTNLEPLPDVWVAGVPVVFRVTVANYGSTPARNVNLATKVFRYGSAATTFDPTERLSGSSEPLPAVVFEEIAAGGTATKQFQVYLADAGTHAVEVELPEDTVLIDNRRAATLPLTDASKVLIVDGDLDGRGAFHVAAVLDPGGQVRTGALPDVRPPSFLRTAQASDLAEYRAIYCLDLPEIDGNTADALQTYVNNGGGLTWFIGEQAVLNRYNETLRTATRQLLPGTLTEPIDLDLSGATGTPDMVLGEAHPLSAPLAAVGDAAMALVSVRRSVGIEFPATTDAPVSRIFNRRDGEPLVLQHDVGAGRVVTVLTGLTSAWTNWTSDPTFVVFLLRTNAYLWSAAVPETSSRVDQAMRLALPADQYARPVFYLAAVDAAPRIPVEEQAQPGDDDAILEITFDPLLATIEGRSNLDAMLQPGISEYWLTRLDGSPEVRLDAATVTASEGNLARADRGELRLAMQPLALTFNEAEDVIAAEEGGGGGLVPLILLSLLVLGLVCEQTLGYFASYHTPAVGAKA